MISPTTVTAIPLHDNVSGKLVIIGIRGGRPAGGGASWWFRYNATHRAAEFWGPKPCG